MPNVVEFAAVKAQKVLTIAAECCSIECVLGCISTQ